MLTKLNTMALYTYVNHCIQKLIKELKEKGAIQLACISIIPRIIKTIKFMLIADLWQLRDINKNGIERRAFLCKKGA